MQCIICCCYNLGHRLFTPVTSARSKESKISLMDCIGVMCSGVEKIPFTLPSCRIVGFYWEKLHLHFSLFMEESP